MNKPIWNACTNMSAAGSDLFVMGYLSPEATDALISDEPLVGLKSASLV